ncbi:MAG: hemerythrin domain-containing protein [Spirochaetia bacterium]|nr:hemerythrin domain-containing protein [Spirochaetia bacterium]
MVDPEWHDFYEIGIDFIDSDHRELVSIVKDIERTEKNTDYKDLQNNIIKFIVKAREHFAREELFLSEIQFPDLKNHIQFHNELLNKLDIAKRLCESSTDEQGADQCVEKMIHLVVEEIFKGDIAFKGFLEDEGYIQ